MTTFLGAATRKTTRKENLDQSGGRLQRVRFPDSLSD